MRSFDHLAIYFGLITVATISLFQFILVLGSGPKHASSRYWCTALLAVLCPVLLITAVDAFGPKFFHLFIEGYSYGFLCLFHGLLAAASLLSSHVSFLGELYRPYLVCSDKKALDDLETCDTKILDKKSGYVAN